MSDADLLALYSQRLLALAADIPRLGRLDAPDASATRRSPVCGSTVTVHVRLDGEVVADFAQEVRACALGQAAASVVGRALPGRTAAEVTEARDGLRAMLAGGPAPSGPFAALSALEVARAHPNRHASIMLALEAAAEAVAEAQRKKAAAAGAGGGQ